MSRLLVIEDNPDIADLYASIFADQETVVLPDVPQAIHFLSRHRPDVVITDYHLPSGTAIDVLCHLRRHRALEHIPLLAISVDDTVCGLLMENGANAFLCKPIEIMQLLATVQQLSMCAEAVQIIEVQIAPEAVLSDYMMAYQGVFRRQPDCYWTGRHYLLDRKRCDQTYVLSETERLRTLIQRPPAPKSTLLRLIDRLRRI